MVLPQKFDHTGVMISLFFTFSVKGDLTSTWVDLISKRVYCDITLCEVHFLFSFDKALSVCPAGLLALVKATKQEVTHMQCNGTVSQLARAF